MDRWRRARRWAAIGLCLAAAPLPPVAAWLLFLDHGANPVTLLVTVLAGAVAALLFAAGAAAQRGPAQRRAR